MSNTKMYNHMLDVAFTVVSDKEDPNAIDYEVILSGLAKRLATLIEHNDRDSIGHCDTYKYEDGEEIT